MGGSEVRGMIDPADKATQQLALNEPKKRGRPATGNAKTRAEIQRAYRERKKQELESLMAEAGRRNENNR